MILFFAIDTMYGAILFQIQVCTIECKKRVQPSRAGRYTVPHALERCGTVYRVQAAGVERYDPTSSCQADITSGLCLRLRYEFEVPLSHAHSGVPDPPGAARWFIQHSDPDRVTTPPEARLAYVVTWRPRPMP